jgi:predicted ATPase
VRGRLEAAVAAVGREDELRSLLSRWEQVREGEGQVITIIGEAGMGKSQLVQCSHQQLAATPHAWLEAGAEAFFRDTPFYAVTELLRQVLGEAPEQEQLGQLEARLIAAGLKPTEAIPLPALLPNLPLSAKYLPSVQDPEQQRRRLQATLVEWVLGTRAAAG